MLQNADLRKEIYEDRNINAALIEGACVIGPRLGPLSRILKSSFVRLKHRSPSLLNAIRNPRFSA